MATIKKYNGSTWENAVVRKYGTASEIITPPTTIYADGTAITSYTLKGNTVQNGTPTPSNPVPVVGVGELETTGEHTGEYKIPILTAQGSAVNYLGSVQTTRQIGKLILTGDENWGAHGTIGNWYYVDNIFTPTVNVAAYCDRYNYASYSSASVLTNGQFTYGNPAGETSRYRLIFKDTAQATVTDFKTYLQQQYVAGTPVTVWYVLKDEQTGIVNEPLMKIGTYVDSISNAVAIPAIEGANSITVDTTVQPSEFTATWTGWHNAYVKEKSENLFDKNAATLGKEISGMGYINNPDYFITDFIPIESGETYSKTGGSGTSLVFGNSVLLYDEADISKTPLYKISTGGAEQFTIPQGDYNYMVLNGRVNIIDLGMINQGSTALPYAPYWE